VTMGWADDILDKRESRWVRSRKSRPPAPGLPDRYIHPPKPKNPTVHETTSKLAPGPSTPIQSSINKKITTNTTNRGAFPTPPDKIRLVELMGDIPGIKQEQIAVETGVSEQVVSKILKRRAQIESSLRPYDRVYHDRLLGDRVLGILERADPDAEESIVTRSGDVIKVRTPAKDLRDLAIAQAAMTDKLLLLRGQPTEIHGHLHARAEDIVVLAEKLTKLIEMVGGIGGRTIDINPIS